jgi:hypothetical protein
MNELKILIKEKETRDEIYKIIKNKIKSLKATSGKLMTEEEIKIALFGENLSLMKLQQDASIPPQHYFNLYLKAAQGEAELDRFYKKSDSYLKYSIKQVQEQIEIQRRIMEDKKLSKTYEKRNFTNYYDNYKEDLEKINKFNEENIERIEEVHNYKKALAQSRQTQFKEIAAAAQFYKEVDIYIKKKGYDVYNLTQEEVNDLESYRNAKAFELKVKDYFIKEKENEYVDLLKRGEMTHKLKKRFDKLNADLKSLKKEEKVFRPYVKGQLTSPIIEQEFLSQEELNLNDSQTWSTIVEKELVDQMLLNEKNKTGYEQLWKKREKYEEMLWRFHDRQVKKCNKPRLFEMKDAREELLSLERERERIVRQNEKKEYEKSMKSFRELH